MSRKVLYLWLQISLYIPSVRSNLQLISNLSDKNQVHPHNLWESRGIAPFKSSSVYPRATEILHPNCCIQYFNLEVKNWRLLLCQTFYHFHTTTHFSNTFTAKGSCWESSKFYRRSYKQQHKISKMPTQLTWCREDLPIIDHHILGQTQ